MNEQVEQWGIFELELQGPSLDNSFLEVELSAEFRCDDTVLRPQGFYDGDGVYRVRFMPTRQGVWTYTTRSSAAELGGHTGTFTCAAPLPNNHGPVHVHNTFHFAYADGTPYYPFGTTCYAWTHQDAALEEQTLATLKETAFNKLRMCVFPKHYPFSHNEPALHPFEAGDFSRFDPVFFQHLETRLKDLLELGIEADLIIWHPYDRWGYMAMDEEADIRYLRHLIARLGAFRHVWWSLANEYDFLLSVKPPERWDRFFQILQTEDPYRHLRSIHNGDVDKNYDHTNPAVTHVSIQNAAVRDVPLWRERYGKPIVNDELEYEGDLPYPWGAITAEEQTHRFWMTVASGGYAGHGETYFSEDGVLWWSKGGTLRGTSWERMGFLREVLEAAPPGGLTPQRGSEYTLFPGRMGDYFNLKFAGGFVGDFHLIYLGEYRPKVLVVPPTTEGYRVDLIDTWEMTVAPLTPTELHGGETYVYDGAKGYALALPGKPYLALRFSR